MRAALAATLSLLFAACAGDDSPPAPTPTSPPGRTDTPTPPPPAPTPSATCTCATPTSTAAPLPSCCGFEGGCRTTIPSLDHCLAHESTFYPPHVCDPDRLACAIPATSTPTPTTTPTCGACPFPSCAVGDSVACEDPRCGCGCTCTSPTPTPTAEATRTRTETPIEIQPSCCQRYSPDSCFRPESPSSCFGQLFTQPYACNEATGRCEAPPSRTPGVS